MELKVNRSDFLTTLYWTQSIVERRNTMPILANILLEATAKEIRVTATDLEIGVRGRLSGTVAKEGMATVSAKKMYEIVREAPADEVYCRRLDNDWVEIRSGRSVFKVVGMDAKEFPQFPKVNESKLSPVSAKVIGGMIERTIFAASSDETRHNLNGVFCEQAAGKKLRMVATDGHRLALVETEVATLGMDKGVILPRKGLLEVKKIIEQIEDGEIWMGFQDNMALARNGNVELYMRLIDGEFPEYNKVVPRDNPNVVKVERDALLSALKRVSILSSDRYRGIKIEVRNGSVVVSANNPDLGEANEEVEVEYKGKSIAVGFNARYLIDVLNVFGEGGEVELSLNDETSPGLIKREGDESYLYVVMPMRL
jgi:DNA polymerase-3 subunit beta